MITIHTAPEDVPGEIEALELQFASRSLIADRIIIGDLNADCSYYNVEDKEFEGWIWVIPDDEDTTVGKTDCAYDRIILNKGAEDNLIQYGVMRDVNETQSDHYLIWAEFQA